MKNYFLILFFLISNFIHVKAIAGRIGFSDETWKTIHTEHFDIIFSAKQQDLGLYYANIAENAYENLSTVFSNRPFRTVLILNETTDISNGYATRIPYAHIMAYTVPIGDHESLSESGEWARELITHELTHIMQMEPALGFYKYIRPIFGNIVTPNLLLPLWWKEGMAVEMETQFSPQGRTRSKFQDASIRAFVLDRQLFQYTLAQANEVLPSWPYGSRAYLFGSVFWSSLVSDSKLSSVNRITSRQAERVPYFVEEPIYELTDRSYEAQYTKALYEHEKIALAQLDQLKTEPTTSLKTISLKGQSAIAPKWSEKNQMLCYIENIEDEAEIACLNTELEKIKFKNPPRGKISGLDFHPNDSVIAYAKVDQLNSKYDVSDIYFYDLTKNKSEQITFNQHARNISYSDDGKNIVYISTENGETQIKILHIEDRKIELIASSGVKNRFQSPIFWTPEEILVSQRNENGIQSLYSINITNHSKSSINLPFSDIRFLKKINSGNRKELYFTSSENGVHNIYVTLDLKTAKPVTNSLTGLWSYDIDPLHQKIWATEMSNHGFQVGSADLKKRNQALPVIENKIADRYKYKVKKLNHKDYTAEDYSAAGYLIPTYWIPYIATSTSSKGVFFQAQTSGHDPVNIHEYSLIASYETDIQKFGFVGAYTNSAFAVPFQVGALIRNQSFGDANTVVETKTSYLSLLPDLFWLNKNLLFQIGLQTQETNFAGLQTQHWGPFTQVVYQNYAQNIFQISPEKGWGAYLKYENNQNLKNSREFNKASASVVDYFSAWLPKHHVLMARASGLATFETVPARFGTSNNTLFLNSDLVIPQFVLRGYQPSQFYGRSMWNVNTEYRFPLKNIERGSGTDAYFLKRLSGAIVVDGLGVDGGSIKEDNSFEKRSINESFWSSGLELKLETTIGYVFPINFVLGTYLPYSPQYSSSVQTGVSIQIGGF